MSVALLIIVAAAVALYYAQMLGARDENPPFGRGETFYGIQPAVAIDPLNLGGQQMEGKIWEFEDLNFATTPGSKTNRSNRPVKCMIVRNAAAIPLLPMRLCSLQKAGTDGRYFLGRIDGYTTTQGQEGYPLDEWLPAAGLQPNDLGWLVVDGPAMCLYDLAGTTAINVGDIVMALTAA